MEHSNPSERISQYSMFRIIKAITGNDKKASKAVYFVL
jgi:hypothetical protein